MTPLRGLPIAVIDVETTGLDFEADHIVEIAVAHGTLGDDLPTMAYVSRVRPPIPVPEAVTRIHGITDADRGPRPECPWHTFLGRELPPWDVPAPAYTVDRQGHVVPAGRAA